MHEELEINLINSWPKKKENQFWMSVEKVLEKLYKKKQDEHTGKK